MGAQPEDLFGRRFQFLGEDAPGRDNGGGDTPPSRPTRVTPDDVISFESHATPPHPEWSRIIPDPENGQTVIVRAWDPGDAARCRLCPRGTCVAENNICLLMVPKIVGDHDAAMFSTVGMPRRRRPSTSGPSHGIDSTNRPGPRSDLVTGDPSHE